MGSNPISCGSSGLQQSYHSSPSVEGQAARSNEPVDIVNEGLCVIVAEAVAEVVVLAKTEPEGISVNPSNPTGEAPTVSQIHLFRKYVRAKEKRSLRNNKCLSELHNGHSFLLFTVTNE